MLNVFDYIENYCKVHNITAKSFKSCVLTKDNVNDALTFAPGIAFFYRIRAVGEIHNIANINKPFMLVQTPTDVWDFAKIGSIYDDGEVQRVESDFIFSADNTMKVTLNEGENSLFDSINTLQMFYIYVSILPDDTKAKDNSKVYDIRINRTNY